MNKIVLLILIVWLINVDVSAYSSNPFSYEHYQEFDKKIGLNGLYETISVTKWNKNHFVSLEEYAAGYIFFRRMGNNKEENLFFYYYDSISDHPVFEQQYGYHGECIAEIKYEYEKKKLAKMIGSYRGHFYELRVKYDTEGRILSQDLIGQYNEHTVKQYLYIGNKTYVFSRVGFAKDSALSKIVETDSISHVGVNKYFFHGNIDGVDSSFYDQNWRMTRSSYCYLGEVTYPGSTKYVSETYSYFTPKHNFQYFLDEYTSKKGHIDRPEVLEINTTSIKTGRPVDKSKLIKRFSGDYDFVLKYSGLFIKDLTKRDLHMQ